jgi:hypothetical protein
MAGKGCRIEPDAGGMRFDNVVGQSCALDTLALGDRRNTGPSVMAAASSHALSFSPRESLARQRHAVIIEPKQLYGKTSLKIATPNACKIEGFGDLK